MATLKELITKVKPGDCDMFPLSEISGVEGFRSEALRINNVLREEGVTTKDNKPPYSISVNRKIGFMFIVNNMDT